MEKSSRESSAADSGVRRNGRRIAVVSATVVAALLPGVSFVYNPFGADSPGPTTSASARDTPVTIAPTPQAGAKPAAQQPGTPTRIMIPTLKVDARVVGVETKNRVFDPPADPNLIGWWSEGARPGAEQGSALLTGHTVHTGGGALEDLETLSDGDAITVRTEDGDLNYAVSQVQVLSKDELAAQAETLFDQRSEGRLVVLTCEDWDGKEWESNVVVTALPS